MPGSERDVRLSIAAASVLEAQDPNGAVDVLRRCLPAAEQRSAADARRVYGELVSMLHRQQRVSEAIEEQDKLVHATGRGHALLAMLCKQQGDEAGFAEQLRSLQQHGANEDDIGDLADMLAPKVDDKDSDKVAARKDIDALLTSYLNCDRRRAPLAEIHARVTLAAQYLQMNRSAEVVRVLAPLRDRSWPTVGPAGVYLQVGRKMLARAETDRH